MKMKLIYGLLLVSLVLNLAVVGTAVYRYFTRPDFPAARFSGPPGMMMDHEQRRHLREVMGQFRDKNRPLMERIKSTEHGLFEALRAEDSSRAFTLLDSISDLRRQQSRLAIDHFFDARKNLTAEQSRHILDMILKQRPGREMRGPGFRSGQKGGEGRQYRFRREQMENQLEKEHSRTEEKND